MRWQSPQHTVPHIARLPSRARTLLSRQCRAVTPCLVLLLPPSWPWRSPLWPGRVSAPGEGPGSPDLSDLDSDLCSPPDLPTPDLLASSSQSGKTTRSLVCLHKGNHSSLCDSANAARGLRQGSESAGNQPWTSPTMGEGLSKSFQVGSLPTVARDLKCSLAVGFWKVGPSRIKFGASPQS